MRTYLAKIKIPNEIANNSTGDIGEKIFELWFTLNYQGEQLFKQKADRDFEKIDFADEKGYTYQVKCTKHKTYTFNCCLEALSEHLKAEVYVFIQIIDNYAYIEYLHGKEYVLNYAKFSFKSPEQCYVYSANLNQYKLEI
jgi:hypothetical protein